MQSIFYSLRKKRLVRFGFSGATVLSASRGDSVSINTTVIGRGVVLLKDIHHAKGIVCTRMTFIAPLSLRTRQVVGAVIVVGCPSNTYV